MVTVQVMHAMEKYCLEVPVGTSVNYISHNILNSGLDQHGRNPYELVM